MQVLLSKSRLFEKILVLYRSRLMNMQLLVDFTKNPDRKLKQKLSTPESLRALLSLLVPAAQDWYRDGLIESAAMKQARTDYLSANDFISDFISEFCVINQNASISRKDFLDKIKSEYSAECNRMGDRAIVEAVSKVDRIIYQRGTGNARRFFGISWQKDTTDDDLMSGQPLSKEEFDLSQFD